MQIHWAAKRGDRAAVERQLRRGVPVDARDHDGKTPLMYAAESRRCGAEMLAFLLAGGADPNAVTTALEQTPLMLAASSVRTEAVRLLIRFGADATFKNKSGYTAATNLPSRRSPQSLETLRILLEAGVDPNATSTYGESALRSALGHGNVEAVRLLIDFDAERRREGFTDLMWAVVLGTAEDVRHLLDLGADPRTDGAMHMTPWLLSLMAGDVDKAKLLLEFGADRDARGHCGRTGLMHAVASDRFDAARWLLELGVDIHAVDDFGKTALVVAAGYGAAGCAALLLAAGADALAQSENGDFPITAASNIRTVKVLLAAGANINTVDRCGYWLLKSAAEDTGDVEMVRELLQLGAAVDTTSTGDTALHMAVCWDEIEIVELLLAAGADPNAQDVDGGTPLMGVQSLECALRLLEAGADPRIVDQSGDDAASQQRDTEILELLLRHGASLDTDKALGGGPLHRAAADGDVDRTAFLLARGAELNAPNGWGATPLMFAAERGHVDVMVRLIDAGADVSMVDDDGRTALFHAAAPEALAAFEVTRELSLGFDRLITQPRARFGETAADLRRPDFGYRPSDSIEPIRLLVGAGAKIDSRDAKGRTALLVTASIGRPSRARELLRLGADAGITDNDGRSVRDCAEEHFDEQQKSEILALLGKDPNDPVP